MNAPDLLAALTIGLAAQEDEWNPRVVHVTDLAVALEGDDAHCARQLWLRIRGAAQRPQTAGRMLMFDNSRSMHERVIPVLQAGLKGTGWRLEHVELSLKGLLPPGVESGRMDAVLRGPNGECLIYDTKTLRGRAFGYLKQPKPSHSIQIQTYAQAFDADGGVLLYLDREGQNAGVPFLVERDDALVLRSAKRTREIADGPEPPILLPTLDISLNKGPDSLYLCEPWQCSYCDHRAASCAGALPERLRALDGKIVAKRAKDEAGTLTPTLDSDAGREAFGLVVSLLGKKPGALEQVLFMDAK